jgi:hypothetical protein
MPTRLQQDHDIAEGEQRLERLRQALKEATRAIRDAEAMLNEAERKRHVGL